MRFRPNYTLGRATSILAPVVSIDGNIYPLPPIEEGGTHLGIFRIQDALDILDGQYGVKVALYVMACAEINRPCTNLTGTFRVEDDGTVQLIRVSLPDPVDGPFYANYATDVRDRLDSIPGLLAQLAILRRYRVEQEERHDHPLPRARSAGIKSRTRILRAMTKAGRPCTVREMAQTTGLGTSTVFTHLQRLVQEGAVTKRGGRRGYVLAHDGIRVLV